MVPDTDITRYRPETTFTRSLPEKMSARPILKTLMTTVHHPSQLFPSQHRRSKQDLGTAHT
ncbi:MAG: hypothetical protein DRJ40_02890 [Thermoprotei archaeon]|nr:MAG: hypothetical protein DRJ40_02890 [Thermoprotei archaeon]